MDPQSGIAYVIHTPKGPLHDPQAGQLAQTCQIERRLNTVRRPDRIGHPWSDNQVNILLVTARPYAADDRAASRRCLALAATLAGLFLLYPTDYDRPGHRRDFDLVFARRTRVGLKTKPPLRDPKPWRTINSQRLPGNDPAMLPTAARRSLAEILKVDIW